jgi:hypothetical protein
MSICYWLRASGYVYLLLWLSAISLLATYTVAVYFSSFHMLPYAYQGGALLAVAAAASNVTGYALSSKAISLQFV